MVSAVQCPGALSLCSTEGPDPHLVSQEQLVEEAGGPWRFKVSEPTEPAPGSFPTAPGRALSASLGDGDRASGQGAAAHQAAPKATEAEQTIAKENGEGD